jgi:hypothetical protein
VIATVVTQAEEEAVPEVAATPVAKAAPTKGKKNEKQNKK